MTDKLDQPVGKDTANDSIIPGYRFQLELTVEESILMAILVHLGYCTFTGDISGFLFGLERAHQVCNDGTRKDLFGKLANMTTTILKDNGSDAMHPL
jgi:hypothetical protein